LCGGVFAFWHLWWFAFLFVGVFVWDGNILNDKISIRGFADVWSVNRRGQGETGKKLVFYAEPQFWYNVNKHFAIGTEVRLAYNFHWWTPCFKAFPTLGVKYNFR